MIMGGSKSDGQNDAACSSTEETAITLTSSSLHAPHLPFELVVVILCRLPVKQLIQLCCVCKSWNSLISGDSKFAKKHLRLSSSSYDRRHLIISPIYFSGEFFLSSTPISSILNSTTTTSVKLFKYSISDIFIKRFFGHGASTCDGIVCFPINNSSAMLCNPSIRKFKILPPLIFPDQKFVDILYTLVYDRFTNNYKIIALNTGRREKEVHVYTLGTDYWRRIQYFPGPKLIPIPRSGTFVNDSVNWLTFDSASHSQLIVSLDLEKESYQKLSWPVFDDFSSYVALGTLRGCLSFLFDRRDNFSEVWIMKEYCNDKSWTKLLTIPPVGDSDFDRYHKALYISEDDKVLMEFCKNCGRNSLVIYDSINNTFEIPKCENDIFGPMMAHEVYVESLISPW